MAAWTPDQITNLVTQLGLVIGGAVTLVKLLKHNSEMSNKAADSTPSDVTNKILDNAAAAQSQQQPQPITVNNNEPKQ
jgi:hypothetical protein